MKPRISICIPTKNRLPMLKEAIASVIHNGFENFELIVSDDGASPSVKKYVTSLRDQRIKYLSHRCTGISDNWTNAVKNARAPLVMKLDDDDLLLPGFLRAGVNFMKCNPSASMFFTAHEIRFPDGMTKAMIDTDLFRDRELVPGYEYGTAILLNKKRPLNHKSAGIYRTRFLKKIGFFDIMTVDVLSTVAMATLGDIGYSPEILFVYRYHTKGNEGIGWRPLDMTLTSLPRLFAYSWVTSSPEWMSIRGKALDTMGVCAAFMYHSSLKSRKRSREMSELHAQLEKHHPSITGSGFYKLMYLLLRLLPVTLVKIIYHSYSRSRFIRWVVRLCLRVTGK